MSIWINDLKRNLLELSQLQLSISFTAKMLEYIVEQNPAVYGDAIIYAIDELQDRIDALEKGKKEFQATLEAQRKRRMKNQNND